MFLQLTLVLILTLPFAFFGNQDLGLTPLWARLGRAAFLGIVMALYSLKVRQDRQEKAGPHAAPAKV
ncbi:MAG: hypothetical protein EXS41_03565 [Opitutaceae bacterium]|nr:hypothetical protein [Opitutaceae bacterium]